MLDVVDESVNFVVICEFLLSITIFIAPGSNMYDSHFPFHSPFDMLIGKLECFGRFWPEIMLEEQMLQEQLPQEHALGA